MTVARVPNLRVEHLRTETAVLWRRPALCVTQR